MLFNKNKELLHKITNAILLLWLIGAIVSLLVSVIDVKIKDTNSNLTYEEYKNINCYKSEEDLEEEFEFRCSAEYKLSKDESYKTKHTYNSAIMVIVVGSTLFLLNRKTNKKDQ